MNCPKCYGKIDKVSKRCKSCGFSLSSLSGATHKAVYRAKKEGFGDDVLFTTDLPSDISKKKLLHLCIFLGLFGGHNYYTGHFVKAIYSTFVSVVLLVYTILNATVAGFATTMGVVGQWVLSVSTLLMGFNLGMFVIDLVNICTNRFKVSVYKDEFSN